MKHPQWTKFRGVRVNCQDCIAECCKHIAVQIDAPEEWGDFQQLADFLQHENVIVYQDSEKDWLVEFRTRCKNLLNDKRCTRYGTDQYPMTCSEYKVENCVMNAPDDYWEVLLETPEQVAAYAAGQGVRKRIRTSKRRRCNTECCNHLAIPTDDPEGWRDFDDFKWYIYHKDVQVHQDLDGDWFIEVRSPTKERCPTCDAQRCRYDEDDHLVVFTKPEEIDEYCAEHKFVRPVPKGRERLQLSSF